MPYLLTLIAVTAMSAPFKAAAISIEQEGADSRPCELAREQAERLRPMLDDEIGDDDRALALEYIADNSAAAGEAQLWNHFAAGANLLGRHRVAAWAGLETVKLEWIGLYVSNAGVFLLSAGENEAGFAFLNCTYAMGHRTPYLFEALAAYHHEAGNQAETERWIGLARNAAPGDVVIEFEESLVRTGEPPPLPDPPEDRPPIDECIEELEAHRDDVLAALKEQAREAERLKWDYASQMALGAQFFPEASDLALATVRDARDRAAMTRDELGQMVSESGAGGTITEQGYRQTQRVFTDAAVSFCIQTYFLFTRELLNASVQSGVELVFWADVLGVPPSMLARELREIPSQSQTVSVEPLRFEIRNDGPLRVTERRRFNGWGAPWSTGPILKYFHQKLEADAAREETRYNLSRRSPRPERLFREADKRWCNAVKPAYNTLWTELDDRYRRAAHRWDQVATRLRWWGANQVEDARVFARRNVVHMQGPPEFTIDLVNHEFKDVVRFVAPGQSPETSIPRFLDIQAGAFRKWEARNSDRLQSEEVHIAQVCTPTTVREALEQLTDEEPQALLEELNRRSFNEDLTLDASLKPNCNLAIGSFTVGVDHTGKVTSGLDNVELIHEGSKLVGVNVKTGVSHASTIYGPVVGRGGVDVIAGVDTRSRQWNVNIEASASIGLGVAFADDAQAACYPGAVSAKVDGRQLLERDMDMEHVRAVRSARRRQ